MRTRIAILLAAVAAAAGCSADARKTVKDPVVVAPLTNYPVAQLRQSELRNQNFQNNKLFLWHDPLDPKEGAFVLRRAKDIDANEDAGILVRNDISDGDPKLDAAVDALVAKTKALPEAERATIEEYAKLRVEKARSMPPAGDLYLIGKTTRDLDEANKKLADAARDLSGAVRETLAKLGDLGVQKAKLARPEDAARADELKKQIDELEKTLPTDFPKAVRDTKTIRDSALGLLEGQYIDKARHDDLPGLVDKSAAGISEIVGDTRVKTNFDALVTAREKQTMDQFQIGKSGEEMVAEVIRATEYFEGMPDRVTFDFTHDPVAITIIGFPIMGKPEKDLTLSTANGAIHDVTYKELGAELRFEVDTVPGKEYFKFRVGLSRNEANKRLTYQGDMDRYRFDEKTHDWKVRRGVAKLITSN
jgi:hypothetical protein